jgi:hypothetical protein
MEQEPRSDRLARVEERVRVLEAEVLAARQRIHALGNAVNPVAVLVPDVERHDTQLHELTAMVKAARWMVFVLTPLIAVATAATPLLVRYVIKDEIHRVRTP